MEKEKKKTLHDLRGIPCTRYDCWLPNPAAVHGSLLIRTMEDLLCCDFSMLARHNYTSPLQAQLDSELLPGTGCVWSCKLIPIFEMKQVMVVHWNLTAQSLTT